MIECLGKDELGLLLELNKINSFRSQFPVLRAGFGSLGELSGADAARLAKVEGLPKQSVKPLLAGFPGLTPGKELAKVEKAGFEIRTIFDENYPTQLNDLHQPPPVLYINGEMDFDYKLSISVVGSRSTSPAGVNIAEKLSYELASAGFRVISGGARGIDTTAHKSALNAGGKTIAVMACGLDAPYPPENTILFDRIAQSGAVITEFPLGTIPERYNFPARNRIIAALSRGTLVIEAGDRSGALITAEHALELGRDVFAVPGRPTDMSSRGANKLIRDGAFLVMALEDVLERFGVTSSHRRKPGVQIDLSGLSAIEKEVYDEIDLAPVLLDEIAINLGKSVTILIEPLVSLQLKGLVKELPGKSYVRIIG